MTTSRNARWSIVQESTAGTTPTNPAMLALEVASSSTQINAPKMPSDIIRTDANIKQSVALNRSASVSLRSDLVYPTTNEGLWAVVRGGLRTTETAQAAAADACTVIASGNTITRASGSFIADGFAVGDIILTAGASTAANNRFVVVTAVAALTLTCALPDGETWDSGGNEDLTSLTRGARMVNGTTDYSFSVEEAYLDIQKMVVYTGQRVASIDLGFAMGSKASISYSFAGMDGTPGSMASSTVGITGATGYTFTESPVFDPTHAIMVVANNNRMPVRSMSLTVATGARVRHSTSGGAVPDAVVTGATRVQVRLTAYLSVLTQLTEYRAGTELPLWFTMTDSSGKTLGAYLGTVVWDTASLPVAGLDQDVELSISGTATLNDATSDTIRFFRFQ